MSRSSADAARPGGLRERKKIAAMDHIQAVALELFDSRGFAAVTVEEVADAAEVSPSTIYRYFRTKEGLVLHDKWDSAVVALATELVRTEELSDAALGALRETLDEHFVAELDATSRRWEYAMNEPSLNEKALVEVQSWSDQIADSMLASGRYGDRLTQVRPLAAAFTWAVFEVLRAWFEEGRREDVVELLLTTVTRLRPRDA